MTATAATSTSPASTIADLSPEALTALTTRLRAWTERNDVKILAITGVRSTRVQMTYGSHIAIGIDVAFTYTSGRRQRRTKTLAWPIGHYTHVGERDENLPPALWTFLAAAVAAHGAPA